VARLSNITRFPHEYFYCWPCEARWQEQDIQQTWRCPDCNAIISIYGRSEDDRISVKRKRADELEEYDLFVFPASLTEPGNLVLDVTPKGSKVRVALKGHSVQVFENGEPVTTREGIWSAESLPFLED
jgi:DNA-directed RNA polymerase subunit RPC12/RpoP